MRQNYCSRMRITTCCQELVILAASQRDLHQITAMSDFAYCFKNNCQKCECTGKLYVRVRGFERTTLNIFILSNLLRLRSR